jgi:hypothetical protein
VKEKSPSDYLAVKVFSYINVATNSIRTAVRAYTDLYPLAGAFVYQKSGRKWNSVKCRIHKKLGPSEEFQKYVISWTTTFPPSEEQTFRVVFVKKLPPIPCLLHPHIKCSRKVNLMPSDVFVSYPLEPKYFRKRDFKRSINAILQSHGMNALYWDEKTETGHFDCKFCNDIQNSIFVIFELSDCNGNVIFELGLAIGIDKNYFILKRNKSRKLPLDIADFDQIRYGSFKELRNILADRIDKRYLSLA